MIHFIKSRLPQKNQIIQVYAWSSFLIYSWTIFVFAFRLPSWILYLDKFEILSIFAYAMATAFLESIFVMLLFLLLSFFLPPRWFSRTFQAQCFILSLLFLFFAFISIGRNDQLILNAMVTLITLILSILIVRLEEIQLVINRFVERFIPFLYVYLPLSGLGWVIVLLRNMR